MIVGNSDHLICLVSSGLNEFLNHVFSKTKRILVIE